MSQHRKIRVAVVFGGRGPEHPVSCLGGGHLLNVIDRTRYEVVPVGITRDGRWVQVADEPSRLALTDEGEMPSVETVAEPGSQIVPWAGGPAGSSGLDRPPADVVSSAPGEIPHLLGEVDLVLPVLHGPYGEDGTLQGLLEMAGVPYVGAGVLASAVSMDKEYMKLVFAARGLPVGRYVVVHERDWPGRPPTAGTSGQASGSTRVRDAIAELGWPLFVKPARGGSSIGTSKARDMNELHEAIAVARTCDPKVLVEAAVDGAEIEVSVLEGLNGAPPDTSLPGKLELGGGEEYFDFEAKYLDAASVMITPPPIPEDAISELRRLAAAAFEAVSCEGLARVDFFYTPAGNIVINEINTMPGLAPTSYFQRMWEASGMPFAQVVERMLQTGLAKRPGLR